MVSTFFRRIVSKFLLVPLITFAPKSLNINVYTQLLLQL